MGFRAENTRLYDEKGTTLCNGTRPGYTSGVVIGLSRERCGAVTSEEVMPTIQAAAGESGNNQPMVCQPLKNTPIGCDVYNGEITGETAATLTAASGGTNTSGAKVITTSHGGFMIDADDSGVAHTLSATDYKDAPLFPTEWIVITNHKQKKNLNP